MLSTHRPSTYRLAPIRSLGVIFTLLVIAAITAACGSTSTDEATTCLGAGGMCVLGGSGCAQQAPASAQDCNPSGAPSGSFCCITPGDGGGPG